MSENGKGDDPRPMMISKEVWDANHARTFGKKLKWWEKRDLKNVPAEDNPISELPDDITHKINEISKNLESLNAVSETDRKN